MVHKENVNEPMNLLLIWLSGRLTSFLTLNTVSLLV